MSRPYLLGLAGFALLTVTACGPAATTATPTPIDTAVPGTASPAPSTEEGEGDLGLAPVDEQTPAPPVDPPADLPEAQPSAEDCVSFNPANLAVIASGDAWVLRDGNHAMLLFDTKANAEDGKKVARNWTQLCFIGRGNQQADRYRYIITYWKTASGLPIGLAPTNECISYNPATLAIHSGAPHPADPDTTEFALYAGPTPLTFLATEADALRAQLVASTNTKICFIGHGNSRPNPTRYIMEYFRP